MPAREGSQRLGGEGRREALLARWLQEGNKRLRERLGAGLARTSDPGPQPNSSSGKAEKPPVRPPSPAAAAHWFDNKT